MTDQPTRIRLGGYGPPTTSFSRALKLIGDGLEAQFGGRVDVKYVWNIMDLGYRSEDILWLVEEGFLTLGYQSSSYMTERVPELGLVDLPFLFDDTGSARAAMDGALGARMTRAIEERMNYRILGYFENGFRHISNRLRDIRTPDDVAGMKIRVLPSKVHARAFELLGAEPVICDLTEAIAWVTSGELDAQENPLSNTVTYGVHNFHSHITLTGHFYVSRPIFLNRDAFDSWPEDLRLAMEQAVREAVAFQRGETAQEADDARAVLEEKGCTLIELDAGQRKAFAEAMAPIFDEARAAHGDEMFALVKPV
ncbi:MAG: TRAP transporter substrate-binding protein [Rhizobiales bacterium]|nr:TRAP transporter substrate-binding protein [Hyphomicrobiales bacterium]